MYTSQMFRNRLPFVIVLFATAIGTTDAQKRSDKTAPSQPAAAQEIDAAYSAKIKEYTTDRQFITDLVDHLPASSGVPSPEKVLGYVIGAPKKLTYTKDLYRYYDALAASSPRVKVWKAGKSEEGRDFLMVAISSDANMAKLDQLKATTARLADPRGISETEAQNLIATGKPFYWLSGSIHSPETGSPEMLMELAYRLAIDESPAIRKIRDNVVVLITPVLEVDGHDRMVDVYNYHVEHPDKISRNLVYWGHYVAHDNNRDGIVQALQLSKVQMKSFLEWHPQVLHDLHESVPLLYISTGTGPYNAWLDPLVISEWQKLAYNEIEQMTAYGVPGVWTHGYYDGWAANYMFYVANGHNSIGRFYETFGNGGADTYNRTIPRVAATREWFRPSPPPPQVKWSIRNNINLQESALLIALDYTSDHGRDFLSNFYLKSKRAVAKARTEGPVAWVIANDGKRPGLAAQLANLLQSQGCEIHRLDRETDVKTAPAPAPAHAEGTAEAPPPRPATSASVRVPAGSYVVRMDQPYSRIGDMLLDTQYYNVNDPRPYDDTGWTLGPLRNVNTIRVTDLAFLNAPMALLREPARASVAMEGEGSRFYLVNANAEPALATLAFRLRDLTIQAAERAFETGGRRYNAGTYIIPMDGAPPDAIARLRAAADDLGLRVFGVSDDPSVARRLISTPRIALVHSWINTQNEGWYRLALDEMKVPYDYISDQVLGSTLRLRDKYDVIIYPPVGVGLAGLINGVPKRIQPDGSDLDGPLPWMKSDLTPNLVSPTGPDQSADIRGGMGFEGLAHLKKFIEDGGLFLCFTSNSVLPIELGITTGVSIVETHALQARGSVYQSAVEDRESPIAYGYDEKLGVYFNQAPVFRIALAGGGGAGGGGLQPPAAGPRGTGRGTPTDSDIVQGRLYQPNPPDPTPTNPRERELYIDADLREANPAAIPPDSMWPRVIVRFAEEKNLFISGELAGGQELANAPAVVDVPVGKGHVVLYAINPMWRHETQGSFMLVMNAALHWNHLDAGRRPSPHAVSTAAK